MAFLLLFACNPKTSAGYKSFVLLARHIFNGDIKSFSTGEIRMEAVDMGLSVKWSNVNLGATRPEDYGDYFAWGETKPKADYRWETYKWSTGDYNNLTKYYSFFEPSDDAAHVILGGKWRLPTIEEWDELLDESNCTWTWTTRKGVNGCIVTSKKTGNSIFLPAVGYRDGTDLNNAGSRGNYWSSSLYMAPPRSAWSVFFYSVGRGGFCRFGRGGYYRFRGFSIRPVSE